jgi:phosphoglycerate dehydrogenase-like enzyme
VLVWLVMAPHTLIVIADPAEPQIAMLKELPPETAIAVGERPEAFKGAMADTTAILNWAFSNHTLRQILPKCPRLRWVHTRAAGLDTLLFPELVESPALLTNGTGVFSPALGEFAVAAILYFARDFRRLMRSQQEGRWDPFDVVEVAGQTVGIVGYGDIGRHAASRAKALGMEVLAVRRHAPTNGAPDPYASLVYPPERRLEMIAACDYVVVAAPLTPETKGMIGEAELAAMKPGAVIVNVGRGPVIDEAALIRALSEKRIKGAALDVFDREPLPAGHPFYSLENVLLSPHSADHTTDWVDNAMRFFLQQYDRFAKGEPLLNVVDKRLGY